MNTKKSIDLPEIKSSTNVKIRSKKLPPPPLSLPLASNTIPNEDKCSNSNQQIVEQKKSTINCSLSSSSRECSHELIPYILPIGQRSQILETLVNSSSSLLIQPSSSSSETKQKRSQLSLNTNQINFLKQRQALRQNACNDTEWLDFIRCILYKPLETELKILLDKYKMTYFDRINSPNIQDATIRAILCDMVSQVLTTYSNSASTSSLVVENNIPINVSSSTYSNTNGSLKRKRYDQSSTIIINNQTKFVISYIIPDKCDDITNSNKLKYQQQRNKQFQKKYSHLFKYIPDKDEQTYLIREGYLKNQILCCLMLYDEILAYMNQDDMELSGISIDNSFTLSESIITHINLSIQ